MSSIFKEPTKDFYIRKADDSKTFRVSLDIDLSTRFSDWIDPDLLRINRADVVELDINNYKLEERGAGMFGTSQAFQNQRRRTVAESANSIRALVLGRNCEHRRS